MDALEPSPRRRGSFAHSGEGSEADEYAEESAEGVTIRVRIRTIRRHPKLAKHIKPSTASVAALPKSAIETGIRQLSRLPR